MNTPLRFGIIGCSNVAYRRFLPVLNSSPMAELVCVGSRDPNNAEAFAEKFGAPLFGSYEDVLASESVDAVYISTPPSLHTEWIVRAAEAGKHIICEKPAFPDYQSALQTLEICRASGVRLFENYSFLYHPQHQVVAVKLSEGNIGEPKHFSGEFTYPLPSKSDIRLNPELLGGVFHDSAGYPVAAALEHFHSLPISVFAHQEIDRRYGVDNAFLAMMNFGNGQSASIYTAFGVQYRSRYAIVGTKGRIEIERAYSVSPDAETLIHIESDQEVETVKVLPANQFQLALESFCASVIRKNQPKNGKNDILQRQAIMQAAALSIQTQRQVFLSEIQNHQRNSLINA